MDLIRENAYAKLNISLDVNEKRPDGYHNMTMVMQSISLCDELSVEKTDTGRIQIRSVFCLCIRKPPSCMFVHIQYGRFCRGLNLSYSRRGTQTASSQKP